MLRPIVPPQDPPTAGAGSAIPIERDAEGIPEVGVEWVHAHRDEIRLVDVREPAEFCGDLRHVGGAELVPLWELTSKAAAWPRTEPLVLICRSGRRSGLAALQLEAMGFQSAVSLRGGMVAWNAAGYPVQ